MNEKNVINFYSIKDAFGILVMKLREELRKEK